MTGQSPRHQERAWTPTGIEELAERGGDPIGRLELALLAAWRPDTLLVRPGIEGCVLREHSGMTKRANSALVFSRTVPGGLPAIADWYRRRGLPALAMLRTDSRPPEFASPTPDPQVLVMTAAAGRIAGIADGMTDPGRGAAGVAVILDSAPAEALMGRTSSRARPSTEPGRARDLARRLLTSAPLQVFCRTPTGGVGRLAVTGVDGIAVIDGLYVPPPARRRGEATAMIRALAGAALAHGARTVALEVEENNAGAVACYLKAGMRTHHRHRYVVVTADH